MARPRTFDETEVLDRALDVFKERGYEGVSVPALSDKLGICRQSLYNTFGDKRSLYLKALEAYGRREVDAKLALLQSGGSPLENLRTLIRGFAAWAPACPADGCFTVTAMVETRDDPEVLAMVEAQVLRFEDGLREVLARASAAGEIRPEVDSDRLARGIITALYGIGLFARLPSSGRRVGDTVAMLLELLEQAEATTD